MNDQLHSLKLERIVSIYMQICSDNATRYVRVLSEYQVDDLVCALNLLGDRYDDHQVDELIRVINESSTELTINKSSDGFHVTKSVLGQLREDVATRVLDDVFNKLVF